MFNVAAGLKNKSMNDLFFFIYPEAISSDLQNKNIQYLKSEWNSTQRYNSDHSCAVKVVHSLFLFVGSLSRHWHHNSKCTFICSWWVHKLLGNNSTRRNNNRNDFIYKYCIVSSVQLDLHRTITKGNGRGVQCVFGFIKHLLHRIRPSWARLQIDSFDRNGWPRQNNEFIVKTSFLLSPKWVRI